MRVCRVAPLLVLAALALRVHAQDIASPPTPLGPMLDRLASEAAAYGKLAQEVTGEETLRQREMSSQRKLKVRLGESARDRNPVWNDREIVSLYGLSSVGRSLHEIRQVMFVDGQTVLGEDQAQAALTAMLTSHGDQQKLAALKQMQKYTLGGAVTDFGPLILLFSRAGAERYEFTKLGGRQLGAEPAIAYHFKQIDGVEGLTLFARKTQTLPMEGEIWISDVPSGPVRITLLSAVPGSDPLIREEATVSYARSEFGALLPSFIEQVEYRGDALVSEHVFDYENFQKLVRP